MRPIAENEHSDKAQERSRVLTFMEVICGDHPRPKIDIDVCKMIIENSYPPRQQI